MSLYNTNLSKGKPGKSAYQSAVDGGYKGTEDEFNSMLGELGLVLTSTLVSGNTVLTIEDERITESTTLDSIYTSVFNVKMKSVTIENGRIIIEFPPQTENMEVKISLNFDTNKEVVGNGKSAYQYAVDGGYTGTEEEFMELMGTVANFEEKVDTRVDSHLTNSLKWKLVGSSTGTTQITLPSSFTELYIEGYHYGIGAYTTSVIIRDILSSTEKVYDLPYPDSVYGSSSGIWGRFSIKVSTEKIYLAGASYNSGGNSTSATDNSTLKVYYR